MPDIISDPTKQYQCRHIFADGHRCGSKSLRQESFCYYHHTTRKPAPRQTESPASSTFDLPFPEDRAAIQTAIGDVLRRIATNTIDVRRAGLLLYGLQIASLNLPKPVQNKHDRYEDDEDDIVETLETHPTLGIVAPITEFTEPPRRMTLAGSLLHELGDPEDEPKPNILPT